MVARMSSSVPASLLRVSGRTLWFTALAAGAALAAPAPLVHAHFILVAPQAVYTQDGFGSPQKAPPCGEEGTPKVSDKVTTYKPGDTVTITINETIPHPGHYRVALAQSPAELPPEPKVTPGALACGTAPIMDPPVFPVLADGALVHTSALSGPQTFTVKLPSDYTCSHCTLQVIEFMSDHGLNNPGGCYYHHCAVIDIAGPTSGAASDGGLHASDAGTAPSVPVEDSATARVDAGGEEEPREAGSAVAARADAGRSPSGGKDASTATAGSTEDDSSDDGCSVAATGERARLGSALSGLLVLVACRRRRRGIRAE
ncbi:MAG: hypothetical protein JWN48_4365 [Myxococcaceae bacterium]|nr:hypothetical protein [Myxococcaceae bacterium]